MANGSLSRLNGMSKAHLSVNDGVVGGFVQQGPCGATGRVLSR